MIQPSPITSRTEWGAFEFEVADWFVRQGRHHSVATQVAVAGTSKGYPYKIDVVAQEFIPGHFIAARVARFTMLLAIGGALLGGTLTIVGVPVLLLACIVLVGCLVVQKVSGTRAMATTWVECKRTKARAGTAEVRELHEKVQKVRASSRGVDAPQHVCLFSESGFSGPALEHAAACGIRCYRREGNIFVEEPRRSAKVVAASKAVRRPKTKSEGAGDDDDTDLFTPSEVRALVPFYVRLLVPRYIVQLIAFKEHVAKHGPVRISDPENIPGFKESLAKLEGTAAAKSANVPTEG